MSVKSQKGHAKYPVQKLNNVLVTETPIRPPMRSSTKSMRSAKNVRYDESDMIHIGNQSTIVYLIATTFIFISTGLLIVAVASPYWTESDPLGDKDAIEASSEFDDEEAKKINKNRNAFNNIGLWQVCFYRFKYAVDESKHRMASFASNSLNKSPRKSLTGCFTFWSPDLQLILDWLLPPWFRSVQVFTCLGLSSALLLILVLFISFVKRALKVNIIFLLVIVGFTITISIFVFTSSLIYGLNAMEDKWLPRQDLNSFSWSYWAHVSSVIFLSISASLFLVEAKNILHQNRSVSRRIVSSTQVHTNLYEL